MAKLTSYIYELEFVTSKDDPKRAVAFLISDDGRVTAKENFSLLTKNDERHFRTRFDWWKDWHIKPDSYHGWNKSQFSGQYINCFVFEYKEKRFYGFLCNPKKSDRSYQICVLVNYAHKHRHKTDPAMLAEVENIRATDAAQKAIEDSFKEKEYGGSLDRTKH